jgi:hypothetical protein
MGNQSKQLDIIISDRNKTPIFKIGDRNRIVPVECVYAVIEVKSFLDKAELNKIFENMSSVRELEKKAFTDEYQDMRPTFSLYGKEWKIWPIHYFVFSISSIDLALLRDQIEQYHHDNNLPCWKRIDTVCVLNKGIITNMGADSKFDAIPTPDSKLVAQPTNRVLLGFYALMSDYLFQARLPIFTFRTYLSKIQMN